MYKEIKRVVGLINPIVVSLFVGCSSPTEPISPILFELDASDEVINSLGPGAAGCNFTVKHKLIPSYSLNVVYFVRFNRS